MINRRKFLLGGAFVAAGTSSLYAVRNCSDSNSPGSNSVTAKTVPADIHRLVQFDWERVFQDEPLLSGVTPLLEELQLSGPVSALETSSAGKHETLAFGGERSLGAVVWTDWAEGPLPPQLGWERDPSLTERTRTGRTRYTGGDLTAARLNNGAVGIGTQTTVDTLVERWNSTVTEAADVVATHTTASREADVRFSVKQTERVGANMPLDRRISDAYGSLRRVDGDIRATLNLNLESSEHTDAVVSAIESTTVQLLCDTDWDCESRRTGSNRGLLDTNKQFSAADIEYRAPVDEFLNYGGTVLRGVFRGITERS